jgi:hypothetical protein
MPAAHLPGDAGDRVGVVGPDTQRDEAVDRPAHPCLEGLAGDPQVGKRMSRDGD